MTSIFGVTVPHTGTKFMTQFFKNAGLSMQNRSATAIGPKNILQVHTKSNCSEIYYKNFSQYPWVTSLRHPYHCFLSHLSRTPDKDAEELMTYVAMHWNELIACHNHKPLIPLLVECPENKRYTHLLSFASRIFESTNKLLPTIEAYSKYWTPIGIPSTNTLMLEYKSNPSMINQYKIKMLENAVNWYDSFYATVV